jgi:hypothetical protein
LTNYDFKSIEYLASVNDLQYGFVISCGGFSRLHLFQCEERESLFKSISDAAANYIGIPMRVKKEGILMTKFQEEKFGKYRY